MSASALPRMSAEEFIAWSLDQPKTPRLELENGMVVTLESERVAHVRAEQHMFMCLAAAIRKAGLGGEALVDGLAVPIDDSTVFEPDVLVRCGPPLAGDVARVTDPVIAVEALSPSSQMRDPSIELAGCFQLASVRHYLIVAADLGTLIHHERRDDGSILTRIVRSGVVNLDPPGLALAGLFPRGI